MVLVVIKERLFPVLSKSVLNSEQFKTACRRKREVCKIFQTEELQSIEYFTAGSGLGMSCKAFFSGQIFEVELTLSNIRSNRKIQLQLFLQRPKTDFNLCCRLFHGNPSTITTHATYVSTVRKATSLIIQFKLKFTILGKKSKV